MRRDRPRRSAIAVTAADREAREPKGPPFRLTYPAAKPAFYGTVVLDHLGRVWVGRHEQAGADSHEWDVFDGHAKHLGTVQVPRDKRILAITARFIYVIWKHADDVQWLQAYSW